MDAREFVFLWQSVVPFLITLLIAAVWCLIKEWAASDRRDRICATCSYCKSKREER